MGQLNIVLVSQSISKSTEECSFVRGQECIGDTLIHILTQIETLLALLLIRLSYHFMLSVSGTK